MIISTNKFTKVSLTLTPQHRCYYYHIYRQCWSGWSCGCFTKLPRFYPVLWSLFYTLWNPTFIQLFTL